MRRPARVPGGTRTFPCRGKRLRVQRLTDGINKILGRKGAFLAKVQGLVEKLNFAQSSVVGRVGRVAPRPPRALTLWGGRGGLDTRSRRALTWRIQLPSDMAPRVMKPVGFQRDIGLYYDARATGVFGRVRHAGRSLG